MPLTDQESQLIVDSLKEAGINFVAYVPDSVFLKAEKIISQDPTFESICAANENSGLAICAGAWLCGKRPVLMMESFGLYYSLYGITRCCNTFGIPVLLLVSHRGDFGDGLWWAAAASGRQLDSVLEDFHIACEEITNINEIKSSIIRATTAMYDGEASRAVVIGKKAYH